MTPQVQAPLVLALDTTHQRGSLALARGDTVIEQVELEAPDGFAHIVYGHLAALLGRHQITARNIACFASAAGPGSFTGVRIGLACIKGLAEATGVPAVAVSNLEALASIASAPVRAAVMDARRGEIYGALYNAQGRLLCPEVVTGLDSWLASLPPTDLQLVCAGFPDFPALLKGTRFASFAMMPAPRALAGAIARIAHTRFCRGEGQDPAALDANYVRRSDAELMWKE